MSQVQSTLSASRLVSSAPPRGSGRPALPGTPATPQGESAARAGDIPRPSGGQLWTPAGAPFLPPGREPSAPAAETSPTSWRRRLQAASLLALSLVGVAGGAVLAAEPPPAPGVVASTSSLPSPAPPGLPPPVASSAAGVLSTPPPSPDTSPRRLPQPTRLSRLAVDKVEINARIERTAARVGVPADLVKAVAWQESSWTHVRRGDLVRQANRDPATGEVRSVDAGIMQINDRAHPKAYPQAATLDGNLDYGTRHLKLVLDRYGPDQIWRYNGDPAYSLRIERHLKVKPWQPVVLGDHLKALQREKAELLARLPRQEKMLESLRQEVERLQGQAAQGPSRKLANLKSRLAGLEDRVQQDRARLGELATEIPAVKAWLEEEKVRVARTAREVEAELADRLHQQVAELIEQLAERQGRISRLLPRASRVKRQELEEIRRHLAHELARWRQVQAKKEKKSLSGLAELYGELWRARRAAEGHEARLQKIEAGLPPGP